MGTLEEKNACELSLLFGTIVTFSHDSIRIPRYSEGNDIIANKILKRLFEQWRINQNVSQTPTMSTKVGWKKNGPVAAQLFRDFYFKKFKDNTPVAEIHACPNRPYCQLNLNTFYKHVKSTKERVNNYRRLGTGLDNEEFILLVKLNEPPSKEDQGQEPTVEDLDKDQEEDDDSAYTLGDEDTDDEDLDTCTLETALKELNLNGGGIIDVELPKSKKSTPKRATTSKMKPKTVSYRDPINMVYPDKKRILVLFEADGEVDKVEDVQRIKIEGGGTKVVRYTKVPTAKKNAISLIGGVVTGPNQEKSEDVANLQAYLDQRASLVKVSEAEEDGGVWETREELDLEFGVEDQFYDNMGTEIDDFLIDTDGDGLYWCFFWLKGLHAKNMTPAKKKGRRVGRAATTPA